MKYIPRLIESQLLRAYRHFGALILTGPRRSGKTTLLRKLFPQVSYYLLVRGGGQPLTFDEPELNFKVG